MSSRINFGELRLGEIAKNNLLKCIDTDWASSGPLVSQFEDQWGKIFGYKHNKAVSSGTDAVINLISSVYEYGADRGDEVIVPALSFIATSNAVLAAGLTPVFVDVEKETLNIDPSKIEEAITPKTRAIMVVHTMGRPCDMDSINEIAWKHNLLVFEDACEAHGASYNNKHVGNLSDGAAFSFYTAHLINCGEGGMVSTNNDKVAKSVGSTRSHGREEGSKYFNHLRVGYNSKMNDLEASIGLEGISCFWDTFNKRHDFLIKLIEAMKPFEEFAWFSEEPEGSVVCPHGFSITFKDGRYSNVWDLEGLQGMLNNNNIEWKRNFGCIPTQHKAYEFMNHELGDFPNSEYIGDYGIHIGTHHYLSEEDQNRIISVLVSFFEDLKNRKRSNKLSELEGDLL